MSHKPGDWWDKSWNPWEGCVPCSPACKNCWARAMIRQFRDRDPSDIVYYPKRLDKPLKRKKPTRYFVESLGDFYDERVLPPRRSEIMAVMKACPQHQFFILSKRLPQNMAIGYRFPTAIFPNNCWVGATAWDERSCDKAQSKLCAVCCGGVFLSLEPLLGPVKLQRDRLVDWVIVGGETGPGARPMQVDWVRSIRDQCQEVGIPFWFKGWGARVPNGQGYRDYSENLDYAHWCGRGIDGREWNERPEGG